MKKKDIKNLAQEVAQLEMNSSISSRKKEELLYDLMKDLSPKELIILSNYVEKILNKNIDY